MREAGKPAACPLRRRQKFSTCLLVDRFNPPGSPRPSMRAGETENFQMHLSRRSLLVGAESLAASAILTPRLTTTADGQKVLRLQTRQIEVDGKPATRHEASGAFGLILDEGDDINLRLENGLSVPSGLARLRHAVAAGRRPLYFRAADRARPVGRLQIPGRAAGHALDALAFRVAGAGPARGAADRARNPPSRAACRRSSSFSKISPGPTRRRCSTIFASRNPVAWA